MCGSNAIGFLNFSSLSSDIGVSTVNILTVHIYIIHRQTVHVKGFFGKNKKNFPFEKDRFVSKVSAVYSLAQRQMGRVIGRKSIGSVEITYKREVHSLVWGVRNGICFLTAFVVNYLLWSYLEM